MYEDDNIMWEEILKYTENENVLIKNLPTAVLVSEVNSAQILKKYVTLDDAFSIYFWQQGRHILV